MATRRSPATTPYHRLLLPFLPLMLIFSYLLPFASAYRPGDIVPMLRSGQYHGSRSVWFDVIGRHCPAFAVNRIKRGPWTSPSPVYSRRRFLELSHSFHLAAIDLVDFSASGGRSGGGRLGNHRIMVLMPIPKPTGFTGADPYKITFQIGHEKFHVPWLYVINRKSSEVPLIDFHLKYTGNDLLGVTAKVVDMPHHFLELHPDIKKNFWDPQNWPKYVLVSYTWEEQSEIDVAGGFYMLFGSGLVLSFVLAIYVLQSSQEKLTRFVREAVSDSSLPEGGVAKVE